MKPHYRWSWEFKGPIRMGWGVKNHQTVNYDGSIQVHPFWRVSESQFQKLKSYCER